MKFVPYFTLKLKHAFYPDGQRPNFQIAAPPETRRLLQNHHLVLKSRPGEAEIFIEVTESGAAFIPLQKNAVLRFHLIAHDAVFPLSTDLAAFDQTPAPLLSNADSNAGNPVQLALLSRQARERENFIVAQPKAEDRFVLGGRPLPGLSQTDFAVAGLNGVASVSEYVAETKTVALDTSSARAGGLFSISYSTAPKRAKSVFAEVEIHNNASLAAPSEGPGEFEIVFQAKNARWAYYIVSDVSSAAFKIEHQETPAIVFSEANRTDLNASPDPLDEIAVRLAAEFPDFKRWRFLSDAPVACRKTARKSIQLFQNGDRATGALPNPALQNFATIKTQQNGGLQQEDALYQIVKYLVQ